MGSARLAMKWRSRRQGLRRESVLSRSSDHSCVSSASATVRSLITCTSSSGSSMWARPSPRGAGAHCDTARTALAPTGRRGTPPTCRLYGTCLLFTRSYGTHLYIIADNSFASNAMVISNGLSVIYVYSRPYSIVIIYYSCIYHQRNG
jgi:hypothetical protein